MPEQHPLDDLVEHLVRTANLAPGPARRIVDEVIDFFHEPLDAYVRRRHGELQAGGNANTATFVRIRQELAFWRLAAPPVSDRQLRRIVYG